MKTTFCINGNEIMSMEKGFYDIELHDEIELHGVKHLIIKIRKGLDETMIELQNLEEYRFQSYIQTL